MACRHQKYISKQSWINKPLFMLGNGQINNNKCLVSHSGSMQLQDQPWISQWPKLFFSWWSLYANIAYEHGGQRFLRAFHSKLFNFNTNFMLVVEGLHMTKMQLTADCTTTTEKLFVYQSGPRHDDKLRKKGEGYFVSYIAKLHMVNNMTLTAPSHWLFKCWTIVEWINTKA